MDGKIKILFAINNLNLGGAEMVICQQIKNIDKEKFVVRLATLYKSKEPHLIGQIDFLTPEEFKQFNFKKKNPFNLKKWYLVYRFLKKEKFDIVYTHLFETNLIFRFLAFFLGVPVLISFEHSIYYNKSYWQIKADKILSFLTDKIIVSTAAVADFTSRQEGIRKEKFFVIPNPVLLPAKEKINLDELRKELNISEDDFVILTLGRYSAEKGQTFLLQAAQELIKKIPRAKFLLIGYGPLEQSLKNEIKERRLDDCCQLVIQPQKAREFLYLGDVFVLPSLREGQSIVVYEAMMAGLPVVAFSVGGVKDIIVDGQNGLLVPVDDVAGLTERVVYLYSNDEERQNISLNAKSSVAKFDVQYNIRIFEELLENLHNKKIKNV